MYVHQSKVRVNYNGTIILTDGRKFRTTQVEIYEHTCPYCNTPLGLGFEKIFLEKTGTCYSCTTLIDNTNDCVSKLLYVQPGRMELVKERCKKIDPESKFSDTIYNPARNCYQVYWQFSFPRIYVHANCND